jgi:hypothetical protein
MEEALQHQETAQCFGLSPSGPRNDRQDGPRAGHALTFIVDLSKGANQYWVKVISFQKEFRRFMRTTL